MTRLSSGGSTSTGQVRSNNQDSLFVGERLVAVADGMGGHRGGEVASKVALDTLVGALDGETTDALVTGVRSANAAVFEQAHGDPDLRGMGTTLCAVALVTDAGGADHLALVNVGDSRVYLLREGRLEQVTEDHSLVESLVRQGRITPDEAAVHPQRNILTRALGISADVEVDSWVVAAVAGDRFLLCSDGLFNEVDEPVIEATLRKLADPTEAANELVRLANEGGGRDNITAVVLDVEEGGPAGAAPPVPSRVDQASEPDLGAYTGDTAPQPVVPPAPAAAATGAAAGVGGSALIDDLPPAPGAPAEGPAAGPEAGSPAAAAADADAGAGATAPGATAPVVGADAPVEGGAGGAGDAAGAADGPTQPAGAPSATPPPPAPPADAATAAEPAASKPRRFTWRVLVFVVALLALLGLVAYLLAAYARGTYFVAFDGDQVVIEQGRPGGFLIWDPTIEEETGLTRADLQDVAVQRVEEENTLSSLDAAERFVDNLELVDEPSDTASETSSDDDSDSSGAGSKEGGSSSDEPDVDTSGVGPSGEREPTDGGQTSTTAGGGGGSGLRQ